MAVFQIGSIIRSRREEMGLSQEDLADGICAVPTLSRIENNERLPTKNHFEMLMQRLGYNITSLDFFVDRRDFLIHELKFKIRQAYMDLDFPLAIEYLEQFKAILKEGTKIDRQFLMLYQTLLEKNQLSAAKKLDLFEQALQLTSPTYKSGCIPHVLSYEEIIILNNIAICNYSCGDTRRACEILYAIKDYYEHRIVNSEEALRTQPMVLYNLSKILGLSGRYDECIEICDLGIRIAKSSGRSTYLGQTLFNRAWALLQRNSAGDKESAQTNIKHAYAIFTIMDNQKDADVVSKFYRDICSQELSL